jgi:hypothetical protein
MSLVTSSPSPSRSASIFSPNYNHPSFNFERNSNQNSNNTFSSNFGRNSDNTFSSDFGQNSDQNSDNTFSSDFGQNSDQNSDSNLLSYAPSESKPHSVVVQRWKCLFPDAPINNLQKVSKVTKIPKFVLERIVMRGKRSYEAAGSPQKYNGFAWAYTRLAKYLLRESVEYGADSDLCYDKHGRLYAWFSKYHPECIL